MTRAVLETERLRLYEFAEGSPGDAAFVFKLLNEPSFLRNIGDRGVHSLDDAYAYLAKGPVASYRKFGFGLYRLQTKATADTVGMCGLVKRDSLDDADLGYALLPEFCAQGFASEAAAAVLAHARSALGLVRIVAIVDPLNQSSIRVLEKLGFTFEKKLCLPHDDTELMLFASDASIRNTEAP